MDSYTKYAKVAPAIVVMVVPALLTYFLLYPSFDRITILLNPFLKICAVLPITGIYCALGFALREVFRMTSKIFFQNLIFNNDETKMPTTEWLLYSNNILSEQEKKQIREKIKADFNIVLPTWEKEKGNPDEARKEIAYAVSRMREVTRGNKILLQYNYQYGFFRNAIGGLLITIPILLIVAILNQCMQWADSYLGWITLGIQILFFLISIIYNHNAANDYARHLFTAYISNKEK